VLGSSGAMGERYHESGARSPSGKKAGIDRGPKRIVPLAGTSYVFSWPAGDFVEVLPPGGWI